MEIVVLSIHLIVCVCLIGLVLLQRSEGGALGIGGGGGGGGSLMSGRGAADALAKMTSIAGGFFLVTSLSLTFLSGAAADINNRSVFDNLLPRQERSEPAPATPEQTEPARPDPTESSAPQANETDLASISLGPAEAAASPAAVDENAARAGPLAANQAVEATALRADPPPQTNRPTQTAARTTPPPAAAQPRTQPASAPAEEAPEPTRPLNIPNTSGAVSGIALTEDNQFPAESVEVGNGLEAVRRERAGPDQ